MQFREKIKEYKSAYISGTAFAKMQKGNYRHAAILLMEISRNIPNEENIEYIYYCLGRCHFELGQLYSAKYWLSKSFNKYKKVIVTDSSYRCRKGYRDVVELYCKVLRIAGDTDIADKIIYEIDFGS